MSVYRLELCLRSSLGTPLKSDTLFGHLCWGMVYSEGEQRLRAFLDEMHSDSPPLVMSDPLPKGYWPMPTLPGPGPQGYNALLDQLGGRSPESHDLIKKLSRQAFISHESWQGVADRLDAFNVFTQLLQHTQADAPNTKTAVMPHNTINRLTSHTAGGDDDEGGGFFFTTESYLEKCSKPVMYDVWIRSNWSADQLRQVFEQALAGGYGRDASTGKGHLTVECVNEAQLPTVDEPDGVMTLGGCAPSAEDPAEGYWSVDVRHGKLGGAWAAASEGDTAFKYPVILLARGAVFHADSYQPIMGRMLTGVHPTREEIVTCGRTLTLPIRLTREVATCQVTN
jgi:CRISPR-associated protein Csm4